MKTKRLPFLRLTFFGWYILAVIIVVLLCCSCTEHTRARRWGGKETVTLPSGMKLLEVTWKDNDLWYLLEPMDSNYTPKTKTFKEDSRFSVIEGTVKFIECR